VSAQLIQALQNPACYPHPIDQCQIIETHLSWVILTGYFAYKIKKPLNLGFQDFTTLAKRKEYCDKEIFFNQALSEGIYLQVLPISGTFSDPRLGEKGAIIEYAIQMRQFPQKNLLNILATQGALTPTCVRALATRIAHFHQKALVCETSLDYGTPEKVFYAMQQNIAALRAIAKAARYEEILARIEQWSLQTYQQLYRLLQQRKAQGFIRACHGDLHLGNMVMLNEAPVIFDCIEFNEDFRWIDVISDLSFLSMDLERHQLWALAHLLVNDYIEKTQDYEGAQLLRFYQCYRAMVRAKVTGFAITQTTDAVLLPPLYRTLEQLLTLAERNTHTPLPQLTITVGISGTGKTHTTTNYLMQENAIRLRSDVYRRQFAHARYSEATTRAVYGHLAKVSTQLLSAQHSVIIDATCLAQWQRQLFYDVAQKAKVPFRILYFPALALDILRERIQQRQQQGDDFSEATVDLLAQQLKQFEPLTEVEKKYTVFIQGH